MAKRPPAAPPPPNAPPGELDPTDPRRLDRVAGHTFDEAARRLLAPRRPALAPVREALAGVEDPAEAWETLAARELIPTEWTYAGAREVVVTGAPCPLCEERAPYIGHAPDCERRDTPATVRAALTLACDVANVLAAEEIARGAFTRLFEDEAPSRVVWRVGALDGVTKPLASKRPGHSRAKSSKGASVDLYRAMVPTLKSRTDYEKGPSLTLSAWPYYARDNGPWFARALEWFFAFQWDVHAHQNWALAVREKRPNPFTPLCEVWMLGYAVEVIDEDAIVLFAPAVLG